MLTKSTLPSAVKVGPQNRAVVHDDLHRGEDTGVRCEVGEHAGTQLDAARRRPAVEAAVGLVGVLGEVDPVAILVDRQSLVGIAAQALDWPRVGAAIGPHLEDVAVVPLVDAGVAVPSHVSPARSSVSSQASQVPQGVGPPAQLEMVPGEGAYSSALATRVGCRT